MPSHDNNIEYQNKQTNKQTHPQYYAYKTDNVISILH